MAVCADLNISLDGVTTTTFRERVLHETTREGATGVDGRYGAGYFEGAEAEIACPTASPRPSTSTTAPSWPVTSRTRKPSSGPAGFTRARRRPTPLAPRSTPSTRGDDPRRQVHLPRFGRCPCQPGGIRDLGRLDQALNHYASVAWVHIRQLPPPEPQGKVWARHAGARSCRRIKTRPGSKYKNQEAFMPTVRIRPITPDKSPCRVRQRLALGFGIAGNLRTAPRVTSTFASDGRHGHATTRSSRTSARGATPPRTAREHRDD